MYTTIRLWPAEFLAASVIKRNFQHDRSYIIVISHSKNSFKKWFVLCVRWFVLHTAIQKHYRPQVTWPDRSQRRHFSICFQKKLIIGKLIKDNLISYKVAKTKNSNVLLVSSVWTISKSLKNQYAGITFLRSTLRTKIVKSTIKTAPWKMKTEYNSLHSL